MREPPDHLTERVMHLLAAARASAMTPADVIEQLRASLRRHVTSLARRERLHRQTAYDEALERDVEAVAKAIFLWPESEATSERASAQNRTRGDGSGGSKAVLDEAAPENSRADAVSDRGGSRRMLPACSGFCPDAPMESNAG